MEISISAWFCYVASFYDKLLGASFVFTVAARHQIVESEDCVAAFHTVPAWRFDNWEQFVTAAPFSAPLVAVEMGGQVESFF